MGNLLVTMIGIVFCAVLLVAGVSFIKPTAYIEHNQANNNSAQVEALVSDYNKLTVTTGHRPTVADYLTVYANGSTNVHYVNNAGTLMVASRIDGVQAGSGGANQWQFVSGCMGGTADCFCMPLSGASDVTYKATQISALQQMNTGTQSRLAISQTGCNDTAPNKNPTTWGANPSNYYLLVQLNGSGGTPPSASPYTCSAGSYSYTCPTTCGTATETPTPWVCNCSDGVTRGSSYCTPPAGPSCSDYTGCTYSYSGQTYGTCVASCGGGTCQQTLNPNSWQCTRSDGTPSTEAICQAHGIAPPASQTYTNNTACPVNGACSSPLIVDTCATGTPTGYNVSAGTWTCQGSGSGTNASCSVPTANPCILSSFCTCSAGSAQSCNSATGTWTCSAYGINTSCAATPINGGCGTTPPSCNPAEAPTNVVVTNSGNTYTWNCPGQNGGSTASCSYGTGAINESCGSSTNGPSCNPGEAPTNVVVTNNGNTFTWDCPGQNGGASTNGCTISHVWTGMCPVYTAPVPTGPAQCSMCDGSIAFLQQYTCVDQNNNFSSNPATDCAQWITAHSIIQTNPPFDPDNLCYICCSEIPGGGGCTSFPAPTGVAPVASNNLTCNIANPINGLCNNSVKDGCTSGILTGVADNGTTSTWTCAGSNGGSTASCSIADPINGGGCTPLCSVGLLGGPTGCTGSCSNGSSSTCSYSGGIMSWSCSCGGNTIPCVSGP